MRFLYLFPCFGEKLFNVRLIYHFKIEIMAKE